MVGWRLGRFFFFFFFLGGGGGLFGWLGSFSSFLHVGLMFKFWLVVGWFLVVFVLFDMV